MGISGTEIAREAFSLIPLDHDFNSKSNGVEVCMVIMS